MYAWDIEGEMKVMAGEDTTRGLFLERAQIMRLQWPEEKWGNKFVWLNSQQTPHKSQSLRGAYRDGAKKPIIRDETEEQPWQWWQHRESKNNIKVKISPFKETSVPEEYIKWVQWVEKVLECQDYYEVTKWKLVAFEFT